ADLAEGRVALRDPSAEPKRAATSSTPGSYQLTGRLAHRHRHLDRALGRIGDLHRVVEENHDPVAGKLVERALELADQRAQRTVILAQEIENFLRFGGLGEGGVAAQIAEHDDDLAAMAFEDLLVALRDDQFGQLGREKPLQSPNAPQFLDLLDDPRLE